MISVGVVNADQMLLDGMAAWLRLVDGVRLTAAARTVNGLLRSRTVPLDVVVLGLLLADRSDPLDNLRRLLAVGCKVLAIGDAAYAGLGDQALKEGASALLTRDHDLDTLVETIRKIACDEVRERAGPGHGAGYADLYPAGYADPDPAGQRPNLAPQERAVLVAYASGLTLAAAARQIGVQPVTAKNYLARVKEKYRQAGRPTFTKLDLAARVREDGLG